MARVRVLLVDPGLLAHRPLLAPVVQLTKNMDQSTYKNYIEAKKGCNFTCKLARGT